MTDKLQFLADFRPFMVIFLYCGFLCSAQEKTGAKQEIETMLNAWHAAATRADYQAYFDLMTSDGVFIGTDAEENWQNTAFRAYAKPHFDKGKAWSFIPLERNIYLGESQDIAWFDELIDTQMGICRGSGVLTMTDGEWKIKHYVLSITVPNENVEALKSMKYEHDIELAKKLKE
jgi:hypothetical protein